MDLRNTTAEDLVAALPPTEDAVRKARGRNHPLSPAGLKAIRDGYQETVQPAYGLRRETQRLEWKLACLVNQAYGLTADEEALLWKTAPPRMPVMPPSESKVKV